MDITIVITSLGRPNLLVRVIEKLERYGFNGVLLIGDASNLKDALLVKERLKNSSLKHKFVHRPGMTVPNFHKLLCPLISTRYSLCIADGGVLFPQCLQSCISFLEENADHVAVSGDVFLFNRFNTNEIKWLGDYKMPLLSQSRALDRVIAMTEDYRVPMYCVMRSSAWLSVWSGDNETGLDSLSNEIIPALKLSAIGKFGQINRPFLLREIHDKRHILRLVADQRNGNNLETFRRRFIDILSDYISELGVRDPGNLVEKAVHIIIQKNMEKPTFPTKLISLFRRKAVIAIYKNPIASPFLMSYKFKKYKKNKAWKNHDREIFDSMIAWLTNEFQKKSS